MFSNAPANLTSRDLPIHIPLAGHAVAALFLKLLLGVSRTFLENGDEDVGSPLARGGLCRPRREPKHQR